MRRYFPFFLASGFCGLVYETIWLRLGMAAFGVTTPALSIIVSIFMGGLALGALLVARAGSPLSALSARQAARAYALCEAAICLLGLPVPALLRVGGQWLGAVLAGKGAAAWYGAELGWTALVLLPVCAAMGATIPLGMLAIDKSRGDRTSFSYLYLANVLGAVLGTLISAFLLIELLGFSWTALVAAGVNLLVALAAFALAPTAPTVQGELFATPPQSAPVSSGERGLLAAVFLTGFCSMGLEVVWTRAFTPFVGTVVYSFASILAVYLFATFAGSALYRARKNAEAPVGAALWAALAVCAALPLLAADVVHLGTGSLFVETRHWHRGATLLRLALGVAPASFLLGFVTPRLVDRWSGGRSDRAGIAYAVNTLGCILGPLAVGLLLLPNVSERAATILLAVPFAALALVSGGRIASRGRAFAALAVAGIAALWAGTGSVEESTPGAVVLRDHTATVIATGTGMNKRLLVNGVAITMLTPITKMMAHLPLAALGRPPRNALVICFGMGTSFRSAVSWGVPVTAVELVPSVPRLFPYYFDDASRVLASPGVEVVVDDGRRFLETTDKVFDAIIIDPPPPVEAASSSLLYSREFYRLVRKHLAPDGILQQWTPGSDPTTMIAMLAALAAEFPEVRGLPGFGFGLHLLASGRPLQLRPGGELAARLSPAAVRDLTEWGPSADTSLLFSFIVNREVPIAALLAQHDGVPPLTDDRPINEYYVVRSVLGIGVVARRWASAVR
jgi:predicted membrane-bound spermidine synthase